MQPHQLGIILYMATERTPDHKRIKRAEEGRDQWKVKALSRREENEKLKSALNKKTEDLDHLFEQNEKLKKGLNEAERRIAKLEKESELFKKKAF
jgi:septal ring factor EnvC (AmiA/AmiB activator)